MGKEKTPKEEIKIINQTDVGKERQNNEDYYGYFKTRFGELIIVADGMGGYGGGDVASVMAVGIISNYVKNYTGNNPKQMLEEAIQLANRRIFEKSQEDERLRKMGTTVVIALIKGNRAIIAHVGDSRCYHWRNGRIIWVTKDHTKVQAMLDRGWITPQEAKKHPDRHILLQAVGSNKPVDVEFNELILNSADRLLLCTDGLSEYVSSDELGALMDGNLEEVCAKLINLANERGGGDNITVQVAEYRGRAKLMPTRPRVISSKIALGIVGVLATIILAFFAGVYFSKKMPKPEIQHKYIFPAKIEFTEGERGAILLRIIPGADDSIKIEVPLSWEIEPSIYKITKGKEDSIWIEKQGIIMADTLVKLSIKSLKYNSYKKDTIYRLNIRPHNIAQIDTTKSGRVIEGIQKRDTSARVGPELKKKKPLIEIPLDNIKPKLCTTGVKKVEVKVPVFNKDTKPLEIEGICIIKESNKLRKRKKLTIGKEKQDTLIIETPISADISSEEIQKIQNLEIVITVNSEKYIDTLLAIEKK